MTKPSLPNANVDAKHSCVVDPFLDDRSMIRFTLSNDGRIHGSMRLLSPVLILLTVFTAAEAQRRGRGPFGFRGRADGLAGLVFVPEVQAEVELSDEQKELLRALQADLSNQFRARFRRGAGRRFGEARDREQRDAPRQGFETIQRQGDDLVASILEPDQTKRLQELRLQREGIRAFGRAEFVQELGLTDDQIEAIRVVRESNNRNDEGRRVNRDGVEGNGFANSIENQILALLTNNQKATWDTMKGKAFEFPRFERRRNFRGRRRFQPNPQ